MCIKTVSTWCVHCPVHNWSLPCLAISLAISVISCCVTESSSFIAIIFVLRKCSVDWHPTLLNHDVTKRMQVITIYALCPGIPKKYCCLCNSKSFLAPFHAVTISACLLRSMMRINLYYQLLLDFFHATVGVPSSLYHIRCYKNEAELN